MNADFQSSPIDFLQTKQAPKTIQNDNYPPPPPPSQPPSDLAEEENDRRQKPTRVISNSNNKSREKIMHQQQPPDNNKHPGTSVNQLYEPSSLAGINRISSELPPPPTSSASWNGGVPSKATTGLTAPTETIGSAQAASKSLVKSCNSKLCNICHQNILTESLGGGLRLEEGSNRGRKQQLDELGSAGGEQAQQQQQSVQYCQKCLINSIEEDFRLDNYSNHFWRFISNLPKSILQRRRSSSSNLNSEVLGYLERFSASQKQQQQQPAQVIVDTQLDASIQYNNKNIMKQDTDPSTQGKPTRSPDRDHLTLISSSGRPEDCNADGRPPAAAAEKALVENVQLKERCLVVGGEGPGSGLGLAGQKLIRIKSPSEQAGALLNSSKQHQVANKLSIATTITTRSSVSSLSSCILSSSSSSEVRLKWGKKMDFLLSIIGFAVDLANIWRFPYLVYKNGGGVFFIPYVIMLIFGGIPLFFLELCLGQFVKKGPITVWNKICPSMKGVGYCSILVSWYVSFYYNVLIAWSVYFIYRSILSFGDKMPWEDCDNSWNSRGSCVSISQLKELCAAKNDTLDHCRRELFSSVNVTSPAAEFFVKELSQLDQSSGFDDIGYLRPELVLCLAIVYLLHYMSLFRGLETSGKVVWVTATAPYIILSILLVRGLFLPGASMGIAYYLSPKLERLRDPQVWIDAAGQVFYSIGVGFGVHLTYASFNSHNNNCHRDCLMTSAVNAVTSAYSGLVVFVYLGYMAQNLGIEIDKVASEGYSLIFEVYPEALTTLPFARFWSILFFIMLLTLGIDSAMGGLESVITGLEDEFKFAKRLSRGQLTGLVILSSFLPALISCTQGGAYTIFWFDIYSAGVSLLFSALFETIGVVYCYGLKKFIPNVESMLGKRPHIFYLLCWRYISPLFLGGVIVMSIITAQVPVYRNYTFPYWSIVLGWCLAFSSVAVVPLFALWYWATDQKTKRITSSPDRRKKDRSSVGSSKKTPSNFTPVSVNCPNHAQTSATRSGTNTLLTTTTITTILDDHQQML